MSKAYDDMQQHFINMGKASASLDAALVEVFHKAAIQAFGRTPMLDREATTLVDDIIRTPIKGKQGLFRICQNTGHVDLIEKNGVMRVQIYRDGIKKPDCNTFILGRTPASTERIARELLRGLARKRLLKPGAV